MFTKQKLKKHKGQLIKLSYNGKSKKKQTGKITAVTHDHVLFKVNCEYEKPIKIKSIAEIEPLKTFSHYKRTIRSIIKDKPEKAIEMLIEINEIFNLHEQKAEINKLSKQLNLKL